MLFVLRSLLKSIKKDNNKRLVTYLPEQVSVKYSIVSKEEKIEGGFFFKYVGITATIVNTKDNDGDATIAAAADDDYDN